jgi:hypothetical protein
MCQNLVIGAEAATLNMIDNFSRNVGERGEHLLFNLLYALVFSQMH